MSITSVRDQLMQLGDRNTFDNAMDIELKRRQQNGDHLSVALLDLDGFKGLNDALGQHVGDRALLLVAEILTEQSRQTDTIARLEKDEFVVVMPNTKASDCKSLCQLFCDTIRAKMVEVFSYPMTATVGFTTIEN